MNWLVRHITYPLFMIYDGNHRILKYLNKYEYLNSCSYADSKNVQLENLRALLKYSYANTSYYNSLFNEFGLNPNKIKCLDDIKIIPPLTKQKIFENFDALKSKTIPEDRVRLDSTGGSTGTPLKFLRDLDCLYERKAQELYFDKKYMGYNIGDKVGYFVSASHAKDNYSRIKAKLRNALCERMLVFSPYDIDPEYLNEFTNRFFKYKPQIIKCFPNSLVIFAKHLQANSIEIKWVRAISCTGETLHDDQKILFRSVFPNSIIIEKYASIECGVMACSCGDDTIMHEFSPGIYMEIIDSEGKNVQPGGMGKILITDLFSKALPLIRYEIGDLAISDDGQGLCCCDSKLQKVKKILGRDRDIIYDVKSNPRPGYVFVNIIDKLGFKGQFQIIQKLNRDIVIKVANTKLNRDEKKTIEFEFRAKLGEGMNIRILEVDKIERDKSGKYSYVRNEKRFI
jgi:phenylacetate-CoA ligase